MVAGTLYMVPSVSYSRLSFHTIPLRFPRQVIKVTFAISIIVYLAVAVYYFVRGLWMPAIFGLIFGVLYASMWWFWKSRIPFAAVSLPHH